MAIPHEECREDFVVSSSVIMNCATLMANLAFTTNRSNSPGLRRQHRSAREYGNGSASANQSTAQKALDRGIAHKFENYDNWVCRIL